jgi:predicted RNA binding protein YcfA (HicA-like mRNA interferase family)
MKLPRDVPALDVVKVLSKHGWVAYKQEGSHLYLINSKKEILQVPMHNALKTGTLSSIINRSGIDRDVFISEL